MQNQDFGDVGNRDFSAQQNRFNDRQDHKNILLKQKQMKDISREMNANSQLMQEGNLGYIKETSNLYLQKKTLNEDRNFKQSLKNNHSQQELLKQQEKQLKRYNDIQQERHILDNALQSLEQERFHNQMQKQANKALFQQQLEEKQIQKTFQQQTKQSDQEEWNRLFDENNQKIQKKINERNQYYLKINENMKQKINNFQVNQSGNKNYKNLLHNQEYIQQDHDEITIKSNQKKSYKDFLDFQVNQKTQKDDQNDYRSLDKAGEQPMIPGIYNHQTVGATPLKRGLKKEDHLRIQKMMVEKDYSQNINNKLPSLQSQSQQILPNIDQRMNRQNSSIDVNGQSQYNSQDFQINLSNQRKKTQMELYNDFSKSPYIDGGSNLKNNKKYGSNLIQRYQNVPIKMNNSQSEQTAKLMENGIDQNKYTYMDAKLQTMNLQTHNPITNPLSYVNQNPYIRKQIQENQQFVTPNLNIKNKSYDINSNYEFSKENKNLNQNMLKQANQSPPEKYSPSKFIQQYPQSQNQKISNTFKSSVFM